MINWMVLGQITATIVGVLVLLFLPIGLLACALTNEKKWWWIPAVWLFIVTVVGNYMLAMAIRGEA